MNIYPLALNPSEVVTKLANLSQPPAKRAVLFQSQRPNGAWMVEIISNRMCLLSRQLVSDAHRQEIALTVARFNADPDAGWAQLCADADAGVSTILEAALKEAQVAHDAWREVVSTPA